MDMTRQSLFLHACVCVHHLLPLFNKVFSADVSHDARGQRVTHHIDHGPESIPGKNQSKCTNAVLE